MGVDLNKDCKVTLLGVLPLIDKVSMWSVSEEYRSLLGESFIDGVKELLLQEPSQSALLICIRLDLMKEFEEEVAYLLREVELSYERCYDEDGSYDPEKYKRCVYKELSIVVDECIKRDSVAYYKALSPILDESYDFYKGDMWVLDHLLLAVEEDSVSIIKYIATKRVQYNEVYADRMEPVLQLSRDTGNRNAYNYISECIYNVLQAE